MQAALRMGGATSWVTAYQKDSATLQKVHSLIAKDRSANQKKDN
jgi:hypothetical protein